MADAVWNNRYVLQGEPDVKTDNTLSGDGTAQNPLGLNETVLWDGNKMWWNNTSELEVSGNLSDYESFKVVYSDDWELKPIICEYPGDNTSFDTSIFGAEGNNITFKSSKFTVSGNKINLDKSRTIEVNQSGNISTVIFTTSYIKFYKIIGINRKSST